MMNGSATGGGESAGVVFPASADGRRSTSALGRAVVADALRPVDPAGALGAEHETNWRSGYLVHFRRLIEAGLASKQAWLEIARGGLDSLHARMRVAAPGGDEAGLGSLLTAPARHRFVTATVHGTGEAEREFALPYHGDRLRGDALARKLDAWVTAGVIEPTCADAIRAVAAHPEWLRLPGRTVAVLGAGAEMGPLPVLLGWGARVAGVDLPRPALWDRVLRTAQGSGGTLLVPVAAPPAGRMRPAEPGRGDAPEGAPVRGRGDPAGAQRLDLAGDVPGRRGLARGPGRARWCWATTSTPTARPTCGSPPPSTRSPCACRPRADDLALAFLATPDRRVRGAAPTRSRSRSAPTRPAPAARSWPAGRCGRCRAGGCCAAPTCPAPTPASTTAWSPSRARTTRWPSGCSGGGPRSPATAGATVSLNVAPPTRTRSVVKNRALAAAYAGAHRFGVEVFEPATTNVLMAALLVHDLHTGGGPAHEHPWQDEAYAAAHGGLWRIAYAPRSALGLAALLGYGAARG